MSDLVNALTTLGLRHTAAHLDDVVALATKRRGASPNCSSTSWRASSRSARAAASSAACSAAASAASPR